MHENHETVFSEANIVAELTRPNTFEDAKSHHVVLAGDHVPSISGLRAAARTNINEAKKELKAPSGATVRTQTIYKCLEETSVRLQQTVMDPSGRAN